MRWLLAGVLALVPCTALAAPIEFVDTAESFWIFDDIDNTVEYGNFFDRDPFYVAYDAIEDGFLAVHPDDSQLIVVFTTWTLPGPVGALYQSTANDVHGIGYEHIADLDPVIPAPYFDDTPDSQVQGFLHMNDWTNYIGEDPGGTDDSRISLVFGQELGHAWLAFVHVDAPGIDPRILLGRSDAHWNFYLHTEGSPVQGHNWTDNGDGTFTASKTDIFEFSELDLYLMGLIPADQVAPFFAIVDPQDCIDSAQKDGGCAPVDAFQFEAPSYTVTGTRVDLTVDDVLAAEGERTPAWPDAPDRYDVSFLLVKRPDEQLGPEELAQLDTIVDRAIEIFDGQTRGLASVRNRTQNVPPPTTGVDESSGSDSEGSATSTTNGGATSQATSAGSDVSGSGGLGNTDTDGSPASGEDGCGCRSDTSPRWSLLVLLLLAIVPRDGISRASPRRHDRPHRALQP